MDEIVIEGLKLVGRHGCEAFERNSEGKFEVSLKLRLPLERAAATDELCDTIDYPAAMAVAEGVFAGESVRLVERLADKIAERLFVRFGNLCSVEVEVAKIGVNVGYEYSKVAARISRDRGFYIK